jgi:hypothetical protein
MANFLDPDCENEVVVRFNDDGSLEGCYLSNNPLDFMGPDEYQDTIDFLIELAKKEPLFDYGQTFDDSCDDPIEAFEQDPDDILRWMLEEMSGTDENNMQNIQF